MLNIMTSEEIQDTTLSKVIKSIKGRYILDVLMHDENYEKQKGEEEFYKYYQPKFLSILSDLAITLHKTGKSYFVKDTPDDVFNILKYGCKNSVVKNFLYEESPDWDIFNNADSIQTEIENFRIFAISVKNFCICNDLNINNKRKEEIIEHFTDNNRYNLLATLLITVHGTYRIQKKIEVLLSSLTVDDESTTETYHRLNQFREQQDFIIEQLERIKRDNLL